jgi:hypothetical protein
VVNDVDWMQVAQDRDKCWAILVTTRKLLFLKTEQFLDCIREC